MIFFYIKYYCKWCEKNMKTDCSSMCCTSSQGCSHFVVLLHKCLHIPLLSAQNNKNVICLASPWNGTVSYIKKAHIPNDITMQSHDVSGILFLEYITFSEFDRRKQFFSPTFWMILHTRKATALYWSHNTFQWNMLFQLHVALDGSQCVTHHEIITRF